MIPHFEKEIIQIIDKLPHNLYAEWEKGMSDAILSNQQKYGLKHIEETSDVISSSRQEEINKAAFEYAMEYNILILDYLSKRVNDQADQ